MLGELLGDFVALQDVLEGRDPESELLGEAKELKDLVGPVRVGVNQALAAKNLGEGLQLQVPSRRHGVALALGFVGRLDEAIEQARLACRRDDKLHNPRVVLAALLVTEKRLEEAASALAEARRIRPQLSLREARGIVGGRYAKALRKIWEL